MAQLKSTNINGDLKVNNGNIFGNIEGTATLDTINNQLGSSLNIRNLSGDCATIQFSNSSSTYGYIGMMSSNGNLHRFDTDGNAYKIYDSSSQIKISEGGTGISLNNTCFGWVVPNCGNTMQFFSPTSSYCCQILVAQCCGYDSATGQYKYCWTTKHLGSAAFCSASSLNSTPSIVRYRTLCASDICFENHLYANYVCCNASSPWGTNHCWYYCGCWGGYVCAWHYQGTIPEWAEAIAITSKNNNLHISASAHLDWADYSCFWCDNNYQCNYERTCYYSCCCDVSRDVNFYFLKCSCIRIDLPSITFKLPTSYCGCSCPGGSPWRSENCFYFTNVSSYANISGEVNFFCGCK